MSKFKYLIFILPLFAVFFGCKTTEENYKKAYDAAKSKEADPLDETIYNKIRREATNTQVAVGDTLIDVKREIVKVAEGQDIPQERMKRYNVVVAQFKQLFHAKSMKKRIIDAGYHATFIVETREPLYYVVAVTTDNADEAAEALYFFEKSSPVRLVEPCPWILTPAGR